MQLRSVNFGNSDGLNAMELNKNSNQAACFDGPENLLNTMNEPTLDNESSHCVDCKQDDSLDCDAVSEKVDANLVPIKADTQAVNVVNGEYCGIFTQLSIDYVDIFEILKEEILAAEARELEVDGLLNPGEEFEEPPRLEERESTFMRDSKVTGIDRDDCQGGTQNCGKATDLAETALTLKNSENGQVELLRSPSAELPEDTFLKGVAEMGAENKAAPSGDNEAGFEDRLKLVDVTDMGSAQDNQVASGGEHTESSTSTREGSFEQACQNDAKVDPEGTLPHSNLQANGDTFWKEDERAGEDKGEGTLLDSSTGDDGDQLLQNDMSEHSEDDDYISGPFSGPVAFSGMLSYSGIISYSGQIPHSGNMSLHSDSSTSTRSFAFPILASDWTSSPVKIGKPDSRYFRRHRRWRSFFCCRRPATLFD